MKLGSGFYEKVAKGFAVAAAVLSVILLCIGGTSMIGAIIALLICAGLQAVIFLGIAEAVANGEETNQILMEMREALIQDSRIPEGGWVCPKCGKVNQAYTGTCSCGTAKS